jgi:GPH family glycoside/pentoside/hexuronide:cation symporter
VHTAAQPWAPSHWAHARYGALGLPLAFVALPLYVILPSHYASELGVPLAALGLVLLGSRLLDAVADPLIGLWADARLGQPGAPWRGIAWAAVVLAMGFWALFFPMVEGVQARLWWCALTLTVTCWAFSACSITHQAWGTRLGGDATARARWVAWREGLGLLGVLVANGLAASLGPAAMALALSLTLGLGVWALKRAPQPSPNAPAAEPTSAASGITHVAQPSQTWASRWQAWALPLRHAPFRHLLALFLLNGIANAIPATLVLFYVNDVLQRPDWLGICLGAYFLTGALSVPLWVRLVRWLGPSTAWAAAMLGYVFTFGGVVWLGAGDVLAYAMVCTASGLMLGADLTLPGTLLAGVIQRHDAGLNDAALQAAPGASHRQAASSEGIFTGWWQLATKLNLAVAAGLALPALGWLGYTPGSRDPQALWHLTLVYGALPCALKLVAVAAWWGLWHRKGWE